MENTFDSRTMEGKMVRILPDDRLAVALVDHEQGLCFFLLDEDNTLLPDQVQSWEEVRLDWRQRRKYRKVLKRLKERVQVSESLLELRQDRDLDKFRAENDPDRVHVLLLKDNVEPELVWFRLERILDHENKIYQATVLERPADRRYRLVKGALLQVEQILTKDGPLLLYIYD